MLEVSGCKISEIPALQCPQLQVLDVSTNKIDKFENFAGHPTLKILNLSENKLKTMNILNGLPELIEANLSGPGNNISALAGYDGLTALKKLHLENTKIDKIEEEFPELPALEELNLAET